MAYARTMEIARGSEGSFERGDDDRFTDPVTDEECEEAF
jgi:hypothetical protein